MQKKISSGPGIYTIPIPRRHFVVFPKIFPPRNAGYLPGPAPRSSVVERASVGRDALGAADRKRPRKPASPKTDGPKARRFSAEDPPSFLEEKVRRARRRSVVASAANPPVAKEVAHYVTFGSKRPGGRSRLHPTTLRERPNIADTKKIYDPYQWMEKPTQRVP